MRLARFLFVAILVGWFAWSPTVARADGKSALYVLLIDSDDAEDQAEALTNALRARARSSPSWALAETPNTLSMLTTALRCPKVPDATCLDRIAGHLKTERYIWGLMQKAPGNQVSIELHFYQKGKPDAPVRERYSDALKDPKDDALKKAAAALFDRVTGVTTAQVAVHAGTGDGTVFIDGQKRGTLAKGETTIEVPVGSHKVEVQAPGFAPATQEINVLLGREMNVTLTLAPETPPPPPPESSFPLRKVAGWSAMGVGAVVGGIGLVEGIRFLGLRSDLDNVRQANYGYTGVKVENPCVTSRTLEQMGSMDPALPALNTGCSKLNGATTARTVALILGSVGAAIFATGAVLLLTDSSGKEGGADGAPPKDAAPPKASFHVLPSFGPTAREAGLDVVGTF
jgi:hypothetical protein